MAEQSGEFSTEPVPDSHTVGWFRVALVSSMVALSLPTFLTGVEVAAASSPWFALKTILVGSLILTLVSGFTAVIGSKTRLSSYMLNRAAFGRGGAALVNIAFAISLLGWFGVNIDLFSHAVLRLTKDMFDLELRVWPVELFAGVIMTVTTALGFKAIDRLSMLLVPVLVMVTAQLIAGSLADNSLTEIMSGGGTDTLSFGDGVSAVVGGVIIGSVILPDITRFIKHWVGAVYLVLMAYMVVEVVVMLSGALAATVLGDRDLLNIMITMGIGLAAAAIVIFGSWILNSLNLYSTVLSVESSVGNTYNTLMIVVMGSLGTLAAFFGILDSFLDFIFYLAIIFIPVPGVIVVDYFILRKHAYHEQRVSLERKLRPQALLSWALGACVSLGGAWGWFSISSIAAIDAIAVAALSYYGLSVFFPQREALPVELS